MVLTQRQMLLDGGTGASAATPSLVPPSPKPEPTLPEDRPMVEPLAGLAASKARKRQDTIVNPEVPVAPDTPKPKTDWGGQPSPGFIANLRSKILGIDPPKPESAPRPAPKTPRTYGILQPTLERVEAANRAANVPEYLRNQGFGRTAGVASFLEGQGSINPIAPYFGRRPGKGAALALLGVNTAMQLGLAESDEDYKSAIREYLAQWGYPDDVIEGATTSSVGASTVASIAGGMADAAIQDAQIVGAFGVAGAAAGATYFGVGAVPGFFVGTGVGRVVAGASSMIDYAIEPLLKAMTGNSDSTDNWIPTAYDLIPFKSTVATESWSETGEQAGIDGYFSTQQSGKFLSPTMADAEQKRLHSNYYANNPSVKDPRIDEITELISMGHFIGKDDRGVWGIDSDAYWQYRNETVAIIDKDAARKFLPPLSAEGKEWYSTYGKSFNENVWNSLFMNEFVR